MKKLFLLIPLIAPALPCFAAFQVKLSSSLTSPQPVATPITWTATASKTTDVLDYQFSVSRGSDAFQVAQDYSPLTTFTWAPYRAEGSFTVQVISRDRTAGTSATAQAPFVISSRVTGSTPVISKTAHPLVVLYSAPGCPSGSSMYVVFTSGNSSVQTNTLACTPNASMNFYLAGMAANSSHTAHHVVQTGSNTTSGPTLSFTTGAIPTNLLFPSVTIDTPPNAQTASQQSVLLIDNIGPNGPSGKTGSYFPTAYNLNGKVLWYYPGLSDKTQNGAYYLRPIDGGTFMVHLNDPTSSLVVNQIWREFDLAGNTVRQTNVARVNEQIAASGYVGCTSFSHDAIRLPNGHTMIICTQEKIYPPPTQGSTTNVDIEGNAIVDLDQNLQLAWYWSAYDHLDINRPAVLGEVIRPNNGFVTLVLANQANDWLHANSLNYIPSSGDVIISLRHQDWVAKVNYANGTGDGTVIWEMGQDGLFAINSTDPYPWFTHQHDVEYELNGTTLLSVFDNGNTRVAQNPGLVENSRGVALSVDEPNLVVTPLLLADLGGYAHAAGSAQLLANGDYHFDVAVLPSPNGTTSEHIEITPVPNSTNGTTNTEMTLGTDTYRSYRMVSLYSLN